MTEQTLAQRAEVTITTPEGWKTPPTLTELKQDQTDAQPIHKARVAKINEWLDNLNVTGKAAIKPVPGQSSIQPKVIRKQAEWRYPALSEPFLSTDSVFKVNPVTWEDKDAAKQNELVLNHQFNNKIDKVSFIDEYVRTAVDEGTIIVELGWEYQEEVTEVEVPNMQFVVNDDLMPLHQELAKLKQESPSQYATDVPDELKEAHDLFVEDGRPIEPQPIEGTRKVKKTKVLCNKPTVEVCDFENVTIDPLAQGDVTKAGFILRSYETSKSALKKTGRNYQNLEKINLAGNEKSVLSTPDHTPKADSQNFNFSDDARKRFVVTRYWGKRDVHGDGMVTTFVAEWVGDILIRLEESPFPDKELPFVIEHYLPVRKDNYGEPDGALLEDNQKVIGAVTRGMIDIMAKSANGQVGTQKGMLDATNKRKFDQGRDYEYNGGIDPRVGIYMHTYNEIPQSAPLMLQLQNMEAESMTGVKSWSQGVSGAALGDVASANRGALDAASKRELGILRRMSNGMIKIGRKIISMNAVFLSDIEVVRITNDQFVEVRKDDLPGNFDLKLSISTAEEDANKADQLAFMLQTVGPDEDPDMRRLILAEICRLRKMPDLEHKILSFKPQPDPVAQKMQELQIANLEAEIAERRAKTQKLLVEAGLIEAKVVTEGAKADHLSAQTDQSNLDFVEQESGVKQERDKELVGEQARSQGRLKVIDGQLKHQLADKKHEADLLKAYIGKKKA